MLKPQKQQKKEQDQTTKHYKKIKQLQTTTKNYKELQKSLQTPTTQLQKTSKNYKKLNTLRKTTKSINTRRKTTNIDAKTTNCNAKVAFVATADAATAAPWQRPLCVHLLDVMDLAHELHYVIHLM